MNPSLSDEELLLRLSDGDQYAFAEIYDRYWKILFQIAYARIQDQQGTEDVIHEVFASLWKNRKSSKIISLQSYLSSAVKYTIFAQIRKKMQLQNYQKTISNNYGVFEEENNCFYKQLLALTNKEVESLPEKCKLVFKYSRERGLSNAEIAVELKISRKTVENHMNKALNHLRFSLKKILLFFLFI